MANWSSASFLASVSKITLTCASYFKSQIDNSYLPEQAQPSGYAITIPTSKYDGPPKLSHVSWMANSAALRLATRSGPFVFVMNFVSCFQRGDAQQ